MGCYSFMVDLKGTDAGDRDTEPSHVRVVALIAGANLQQVALAWNDHTGALLCQH